MLQNYNHKPIYIFLYDKLMYRYKTLYLPVEFISYGYLNNANLYRTTTLKNANMFVLEDTTNYTPSVFGAIFKLKDKDRIMPFDAYYMCSLNTDDDIYIKTVKEITPIYFKSFEALTNRNWEEFNPINCVVYFGNKSNKFVKKRLEYPYKVIDGIDKVSVLKRLRGIEIDRR